MTTQETDAPVSENTGAPFCGYVRKTVRASFFLQIRRRENDTAPDKDWMPAHETGSGESRFRMRGIIRVFAALSTKEEGRSLPL